MFIRESDIRPSNHENLVRTLCALAIQADFRRSLSTGPTNYLHLRCSPPPQWNMHYFRAGRTTMKSINIASKKSAPKPMHQSRAAKAI